LNQMMNILLVKNLIILFQQRIFPELFWALPCLFFERLVQYVFFAHQNQETQNLINSKYNFFFFSILEIWD
jgi:hypothetical protein